MLQRETDKLAQADEEMKSRVNDHNLQLQRTIRKLEEVELLLTKPKNEELKRLIDDTEADLGRHIDNIEQQRLPNSSRLTNSLLHTLRANSVLVLTGNSGAGKTFHAHQILSWISKSGCHESVIIRDFYDTKHIISSEEPLCILLDDIFGRYSLKNDILAKWNQHMPTFVSQIKRRKFLLLITLNSVREKQCREEDALKVIEEYSYNLDDNGLTQEEKIEMALQCIVGAGDEMIRTLAAETHFPLGFPLLCQLANDNADIDQLMSKSLQDVIGKMEPSSFIPLLMTLLTNGHFNESCLIKKENARMANCFDDIKEHFSSSTIDRPGIISKAESMIGSYLLEKESGVLTFIHLAVLDATFKSAIEKHLVGLLIEFCHLGLLLKLTDNLQGHLTEKLVDKLLKRIDTERVPVKQLSHCMLWKDGTFQDQALKYFANKLDFFMTCDTTDESPFVAFSGLGLSLLLTKILNMKWKLQTSKIENQTDLAILEACSNGHLECVTLLLNQEGTLVRDEYMFRCIRSGNVELFDYLSAKGGCRRATNKQQNKSILHEACIQKQSDLIKRIITCNTSSDRTVLLNMQMTETAETPLCLAAEHCDVETVKFLIDSGSYTDIRDGSGRNILHLALIHGMDDVIQYIENQYPKMLFERTDDGHTTDMFAAQRGNLQRLQTYIELGADPHEVTAEETHILHLSALYGRKAITDYICGIYPEMIHQTNVNLKNAAHFAASGGDTECLKTIINHGIDPLSRTSTQQTLLHLAAWYKHRETVEYLCEIYPQLMQLEDDGKYNAAYYAAVGGDIECLKALINHGIDPMSRTSTKQTMLHLATGYRHPKIVQYICGAYPQIIQLEDESKYNAAHYAAVGGDIECLMALVNHGINPLSRTATQQTLLHLATGYQHPETVQYICGTYPQMIQLKDEDQYNAAQYAAAGGDVECLMIILNHGIDPLSMTATQQTILHLAAWYKHPETDKYICETYPQMIQLKDQDQDNAGHYAARIGDIECLKTLISYGIDPLSGTFNQKTVLYVAERNHHNHIVEYLLKTVPATITPHSHARGDCQRCLAM